MNAATEIDRLLDEHGAVLLRDDKHRVYRLPNGQKFTSPKTPSDHRSMRNNLSSLRHALGVVHQTPNQEGERKMQQQRPTPPTAPQPAPPPPKVESLKERIEAAIASEEAIQEKLLAEAQAHERKVHMLKALLPFTDDPATEDALRGVLPAVEPPAPARPVAPAPPDAITERVQVTRQLVLAATQTFDDPFTVNDVLSLMANGRQIDSNERVRVRASIAQAMMTLHERGELIKEQEHFGRRQTIWRKAELNGTNHSNGVGTRA
ncbi:MAG TPA: hypothetical protein VFA33_06165 [Bryobacteraceae bacterium]|nr:hypothetical protein [Bryobacteraceae bacterium]